MNKNKIILLIIILLMTSGCSIEYNVNIDENIVSEDNIVFIENSTNKNVEKTFQNMVHKYTGPTDSLGMYESSIVQRNGIYGISYKRDYYFDDYNNSVSFSSCYDSYKLANDGDKLTIATSKKFRCFDIYEELDEVTVNLITDYYVEKSNADNIDGNKYTWKINKDNFNDKGISVIIDLKKANNQKKLSNLSAFTLVIISFTLIGLLILLIRRISKRVNKI